jgi:hypothetical protein
LRRRKTRTKPLELGAAVAAALCLSGCGGAKRAAPHPPTLPRSLATAFAARSDAVADALVAGDSCRAVALARQLQRETIAAINRGRVPTSFQENLTGAVNDLAARVTCVPPPPTSTPTTKEHGHGNHEKHGKKHKDRD